MDTDNKKTTKERKSLIARLTPDMIKELKHLAVDRDVSMNALVEEAISDLLKKYQE
jgi:hypothetical protein